MPSTDFIDLASKLERAVQWFLVVSGAGTAADVFTSGSSPGPDQPTRKLPNRTVVVESVTPIKSVRSEGILHLQIQHRFQSVLQPNERYSERRVERDAAVALTNSVMTNQSDGQSFTAVARKITDAGRDLAIPNAALTDPVEIAEDEAIVDDNVDMENFRCDDMAIGQPYLERGHEQKDSTVWMVILNFQCRVSNSADVSD